MKKELIQYITQFSPILVPLVLSIGIVIVIRLTESKSERAARRAMNSVRKQVGEVIRSENG